MNIINHTPFAFAPLMGRVNFPAHTATLVVKAGFRMVPGGVCVALDEQPALEGDVLSKAEAPECLYEADLAQFKPHADLLLNGDCHTPGAEPLTTCPVTFRVGEWSKTLACIGDRVWHKGLVFSKMGDIQPFTRLPIRWANAFGGPKNKANPAGKGQKDGLLPNIEYPDQLIKGAGDKPQPAGFGPVHRTWRLRTEKMGTYDAKWLKERFPAFAADFDWTYFNAAPRDQQLGTFLRGDEEIELINLHPQHASLKSRLPSLRVRVLVRSTAETTANGAPQEVPMNLDTLHVDATKGEVYLLWRGIVDVSHRDWPECRDILIVSEPLEDAKPLEQLLPLFEEEPEEEEPVDAEPQQTPEEMAAEFETELARVEKMAEQYEKQALAQAKNDLPPGTDIKKLIAQASKATPEEGFAALEAAAKRVLAGKNLKGVSPADFSAAKLDPSKDPLFAEGLKQLNKPAPKPPADKRALAALLQSGEAGGGDFSKADLSGEDLSGADLREAWLDSANLAGVSLKGANLAGASLSEADLSNADLSRADLSEADLSRANLSNANLTGATLTDAALTGAIAAGALFNGADAQGAVFSEMQAERAAFKEAKLAQSTFSAANLAGADFTMAELADAAFDGVVATGANFEKAALEGFRGGEASDFSDAVFRQTTAAGSIWEKSVLARADFRQADLREAQFPGCDLSGANLYGADLSGGSLRGCKLAGAKAGNANFFKALLEEADLTDASLIASNFYEAEFLDSQTDGADFEGANLKMTKLAK